MLPDWITPAALLARSEMDRGFAAENARIIECVSTGRRDVALVAYEVRRNRGRTTSRVAIVALGHADGSRTSSMFFSADEIDRVADLLDAADEIDRVADLLDAAAEKLGAETEAA